MALPRLSRGTGFALVAALLAAFFLTVIGASMGYLLAHQARQGARAAPATGEPAPTPTVETPTQAPASTTPGTATAEATAPAGAAPATPSASPTPERCPAVSEAVAVRAGSTGGLTVRLYVRTARSEVWICQDRGGRLWYQGRLLAEPFTAATSNSSLLLGDVSTEPGGYVAINHDAGGDTRYHVSRTVLVLQFVDPAGREKSRRTETVLVSRP